MSATKSTSGGLTGYRPRIEPTTGLKITCGADDERFAIKSQARLLILSINGNDDPLPGLVWSKSNDDGFFLLALQQVESDDWLNDENDIYWKFLHFGSDLPN